jgi:CRP/FNR family transcriptional regulator, cyclic AMP receptor protein
MLESLECALAAAEDAPAGRGSGEKALFMTEPLAGSIPHEGCPILGRLLPSDRDRIFACGRSRDYGAGDYYFSQGEDHEGIHLIESGSVMSYYTSPGGRQITLGYWTSGHFIGAPQIFGGGLHMWSSVAITPSRGMFLPSRKLRALVYEIPDLALGLIEALEQKAKCYTALLQLVATRSMTHRLAHILLNLATHAGRQSDGRLALDKRFTHEELANMIGATRQWVSLTLERFEKSGIIARTPTCTIILDEARLLDQSC